MTVVLPSLFNAVTGTFDSLRGFPSAVDDVMM
jgi:hypothetical protein